MIDKRGDVLCYNESYFADDVVEEDLNRFSHQEEIERWTEQDYHQLCHESLQWAGFNGAEIEGLCFKAKNISVQRDKKSMVIEVKSQR